MFDQKWTTILALSLSLPSTIFISAYILMSLAEEGVISEVVGVLLFILIIANIFFLMIWYAIKNRNKS